MSAITLNQIVESTLQNCGQKFKMLKGPKNCARFVVECNNVKVYGNVTNENYSSKTKKSDGTVLDEINCVVKNTDDVINRIYENINTSNKLSKYVSDCNEARKKYLKPGYVTESEDEDEDDDKELLLSDDEVVVDEPFDLEVALDNVIQKSVDLASEVTGLIDAIDDEEVETKGDLIALAGTFYSIADDIDDVLDELYPEDEIDESIKHHKKISENKKILNKLAEVSLMTRGKPEYRSIREALKLIKAELTVK